MTDQHQHFHFHQDDQSIADELNQLTRIVSALVEITEKMMATLDQVLQDVTDESTQIDGISTLMDGLKKQVADALSGANLPPTVQAKVDAIFTQAETNKGKIATALAANAPPTPAPPSA